MSKKKEPEQVSVRLEATSVGLGANHLCVVLTDESGRETAFRGGPSQEGPSSPPVSVSGSSSPSSQADYGPIRTTEALYRDGFVDFAPKAPKTAVETGRQSARDLEECFRSTARAIDEEQIPYNPLGSNSNSVAFTLLDRCGCRGTPPAWSPGWEKDILGKGKKKKDDT